MADPAQWVPVPLESGMWPDIAPRKAKGYIREGQWIRWRNGQIEPIGGNEIAQSSGSYLGKARRIHQWIDNSGYPLAVVGTHEGVWAMFDTALTEITPIESYFFLSASMTLSTGSTSITIDAAAHGLVAGQRVRFPSTPTVGGIALTSTYYLSSVTTNSFVLTTGFAATSGGSGLGGRTDMDAFLRPGNEFGAAGAGYGTGLYNTGLYGGTLAATYKARTWTFGDIGELLVGVPLGGKLYEYGPSFGSTALAEKVTNGDFALSTSWTYGTGWAHSSGNQNAVASTSSFSLSQTITLTAGRWHRLRATITRSAGSLSIYAGTITVASALSSSGRAVVEFWNPTQTSITLAFTGSSFTGTVDDITVKAMDTMAWNQDAPIASQGVLTTPQGHVMLWGTCPTGTTTQDPMCVRTSDLDNTHTWTTAASNQAREWFLYGGSVILQGVVGPTGICFTTNDAFWEGTYNPSPTVIFNFLPKGTKGVGALGVRAMCAAPDGVYWMSNQKQFKRYRGGRIETLVCPGEDTVFDNLTWVQGDLAEAYYNPYGEVWFVYCDSRDVSAGQDVSRYAMIMLDQQERWSFGQSTRTAWSPAGATGYPIAAESGNLYLHENGDDDNNTSGVSWSFRATAIEIGTGNTLGEVSGYIADVSSQQGPYTIRFYGYQANDRSTPEDSGEVSVATSSEYVQSFFVQGRQIDFEAAGRFRLRYGSPRLLIQDTGNQF